MSQNKKWGFMIFLSVTMLLTLVWYGGSQGLNGQVQAMQDTSSGNKPTISVVGQGEIEVDPDVAYITLGIQTEGKDATEAQLKNSEAFNVLKNTIVKDFQVDEKDLKTTSFNVHPNYQYFEREEPKIVSYTARHMVQITYRELDHIGALLDAASKAGANQINRVEMSTEQAEQYQLQALEKAMQSAKSKADVIAQSMGASIKGALSVTEGGFSGNHSIYMDDMFAVRAKSMDAEQNSTPISIGQIKISAQVQVQYEF